MLLVYERDNLLTVSEQKPAKLNLLLADLGDNDVVSARWLRAHGYSTSLVARYVRSGWLEAVARGAYRRAGSALSWDGVLRSLQQREGLRLHAGGRFALAWQGHDHYLRLGTPEPVTVYGPDRLPQWATSASEHAFLACGRGPFDVESVVLAPNMDRDRMFEAGLHIVATSGAREVVMATPERAMLELCDGKPNAALVYEADAVMQGLAGLRPALMTTLLAACTSVKAKRLFLALAQRHAHAWLARVDLAGVDLGSGKRVLVPGGRLDPKYLVTLPSDLDEHLG